MRSINLRKILSATAFGFFVFLSSGLKADILHLDDVIVDGSQCVGFDCVNGEPFGFDTVRLKENNLRIHFDDTSTTSSYPNNDWRIVINDSANGGLEYFAVQDATMGRIPFRIEAGARNNALYVDDAGRVGFGTSTPFAELHSSDGDTPTLRLEQNGASGWSPQTWDVAGNETNFFIRDVTTGSKLPFRIRPGAPTSSVDIASSGNVGIGTNTPDERLHVWGSGGDTKFLVEEATATQGARDLLELKNNGNPEFRLTNTGNDNSWVLSAGARFVIKNNAGDWVSRIDSVGNLVITGTITTAGGTCGGGCDMVFDPDTSIETIEEHAAFMWGNSYLPAIGPTIENAPFNLTEKTGGILNELEKAHIYIEQLHHRLARLEADQAELRETVELIVSARDNETVLASN